MTAPPPEEPGAPTGLRALTAAILGVHAAMVLRFWWVTDDAFISFRFARNLARGAGLQFNVWDAPPVEGYSNFLWVVLAGGVHAVGLDMVLVMPVLSWMCGALLLAVLFHRLVTRLDVPTPIAVVTTIGLACYPPFAVWSTGGLATMPFALLLFLTFDRLVLARQGPDWLGGGLCGVALTLIRVEGVAWFAVVAVLALFGHWSRRRLVLRPLLGAGLLVAAAFGGHILWRHGYYGEWVANTVHVKRVSGPEFIERGFRYVMASVLTYLTPLLILPGALLALRPRRISTGLGVAALAWAFPVYAVVVSGDYMPMGRFLVPGLAFATILIAWLLTDLARADRSRMAAALVAGSAILVIGALPGWNLHGLPSRARAWCSYRMREPTKTYTEYERWAQMSVKIEGYRRRGRLTRAFADAELEPPVTMAVRALGAIGYETDFLMFDCAGLIIPSLARRVVTEWVDQPGHDKAVSLKSFAAEKATILRVWMFKEGVGPEAVVEGVKGALKTHKDPEVRAQYRPELVKMVPAGDGDSTFLLALLYDEEASFKTWRTLERLAIGKLEKLREIRY